MGGKILPFEVKKETRGNQKREGKVEFGKGALRIREKRRAVKTARWEGGLGPSLKLLFKDLGVRGSVTRGVLILEDRVMEIRKL